MDYPLSNDDFDDDDNSDEDDFGDSDDDGSTDQESSATDDESETTPCPACGAEIYEDAIRCPVCNEYVTPSGRLRSMWWWTAVVLLTLAALFVWTVLR